MASSIQRPQESRKQQRPESPKLFQNDEILFSPDQIEVPPALPVILKDLSKEIIRARVQDRNEMILFSANYFQEKSELIKHLMPCSSFLSMEPEQNGDSTEVII